MFVTEEGKFLGNPRRRTDLTIRIAQRRRERQRFPGWLREVLALAVQRHLDPAVNELLKE